MQIIDFEKKGNVVRFYLGEKDKHWGWINPGFKYNSSNGLTTPGWLKPSDTYYGDDWDDRPYECNAGKVYEEFIKGCKDIAFDFDDIVLEPKDGEFNTEYCKNDFVDRKVPCIIVVTKEAKQKAGIDFDWQCDSFSYALGLDGIKKYYFGDEMDGTKLC